MNQKTIIQHDLCGEIEINRTRRNKRVRLSFNPAEGQFRVSAPTHMAERMILSFLGGVESWIRKQLGTTQPVKRVRARKKNDPITQIPFLGRPYRIIEGPLAGRQLYHIDDSAQVITLDCPQSQWPLRLKHLLKKEIEKTVTELIEKHIRSIGRVPIKVSFRDTRSRWGSCSHTGKISLSWRLIMAPPQILEYVVIHELAHLIHHNHSHHFWQLVEDHYPDHKGARHWLKTNGHQLFQAI